MQVEYLYPVSDGETLQVSFFKKNEAAVKNTLIFIHGFKGFKDWGFFPYCAEYFAEKGFNVISFNFSHNGIGDNPFEFTRLDKFADNTITREVFELKSLIEGIRKGFFGEVLKDSKIALIGHSRGGAVSLSYTNLQKNEISAIALWACVAKLNRYTERQKVEWKRNGFFEVLNSRTNQLMRLNSVLLEDIEKNSEGALNLENAVRNFNRPLLIAHGGQDLTVTVDEAQLLYEWADKENTELFILPASGHTFDVQHPFNGTNDKLERLLETTYNFLKINL